LPTRIFSGITLTRVFRTRIALSRGALTWIALPRIILTRLTLIAAWVVTHRRILSLEWKKLRLPERSEKQQVPRLFVPQALKKSRPPRQRVNTGDAAQQTAWRSSLIQEQASASDPAAEHAKRQRKHASHQGGQAAGPYLSILAFAIVLYSVPIGSKLGANPSSEHGADCPSIKPDEHKQESKKTLECARDPGRYGLGLITMRVTFSAGPT
jgi:hypothetical protein